MIGWTTVSEQAISEELAKGIIDEGLAACVHLEGPITAFFKWKGKVEKEQEYRLMVKYLSNKTEEMAEWLKKQHPYDTPQWFSIKATDVDEKYFKWVCGESE